MNILDRIKSALGMGPKLRNRCNGMAWIRGVDTQNGDSVMNGRAVRTVRLDESGLWQIDPPQRYELTRSTLFVICDTHVPAGSVVQVNAIADEYLEPWKEDGVTPDEVERLFDAPKPVKERAKA